MSDRHAGDGEETPKSLGTMIREHIAKRAEANAAADDFEKKLAVNNEEAPYVIGRARINWNQPIVNAPNIPSVEPMPIPSFPRKKLGAEQAAPFEMWAQWNGVVRKVSSNEDTSKTNVGERASMTNPGFQTSSESNSPTCHCTECRINRGSKTRESTPSNSTGDPSMPKRSGDPSSPYSSVKDDSNGHETAFEYDDGSVNQRTISRVMKAVVNYRKKGRKKDIGKFVGQGLCSVASLVNSNKQNFVMKTNVFGGNANIDAQADWLLWCADNQDNPMAPKIHYLYVFKNGKEYVVLMEKLHSFTDTKISNIDRDWKYVMGEKGGNFSSLIVEIEDAVCSVNRYSKKMDKNVLKTIIAGKFYSDVGMRRESTFDDPKRVERAIENLFPSGEMSKVLYGVSQIAKQRRVRLDMHSGNWMVRNEGGRARAVLIDPLIAN